jgi:hypothetical protein
VLSCEELDRVARISDSADWKLRAVAAKQAAARYLRGDLSGDFWASLFIKNIDVSRGLLELVDPDSAVNAEDSVSVAITPLEDLTVAMAFK